MLAPFFIHAIEHHQGFKVACLEEIAFHNGWLSRSQLAEATKQMGKTPYQSYLLNLLESVS